MIQGFHHVVLFCQDTDASKSWYERAGFSYLRGYHGMHWFSLGSGEIMLHPTNQPSIHTRAEEITTLHVGVPDVQRSFDAVKANGLEPFHHDGPNPLVAPLERPWGDVEFELCDPDGHLWAFTQAAAQHVARLEITARDAVGMETFLERALGWQATQRAPGLLEISGAGLAAHILEWPHAEPTYTGFYVSVPNVAEALQRAVVAGARLIVPETDAATGVTIGMFLSPEGHAIGVMSPRQDRA